MAENCILSKNLKYMFFGIKQHYLDMILSNNCILQFFTGFSKYFGYLLKVYLNDVEV